MTNNNPGCLGFLFRLFGVTSSGSKVASDKQTEDKFPYRLRDDFLSPSEFSFYKILTQVLSDDFIICPKVSLKDIFFVTEKDNGTFHTFFNKINRKHVDFLICISNTMKPVCGIELDDTSHSREVRKQRDDFVNRLYKEAGLNLVRFQNKGSYILSEVRDKLDSFILQNDISLDNKKANTLIDDMQDLNQSPLCPKCGIPFVLRTVKSGTNKGKQFYGCSNYPRCREIKNL